MADTWKTAADATRIEKYEDGTRLFKGEHWEYFYDLANTQHKFPTKEDGEVIYIAANYFGLITKKFADMLFLEPVQITLPDGKDKQQVAIDQIMRDSKSARLNHKIGMAQSYHGDTGYRIIRRPDSTVKLRSLRASQYFPVFDGGDVEEVAAIDRKWLASIGDRRALRVERHDPGVIHNAAFWVDLETGDKIEGEMNDKQFAEAFPGVEREIKTGVEGLLIEHVPNFCVDGEHFGESDYADDGVRSLADELNNRLSQISRILDIHSDPKMKGPADMMDERGTVDASGSKFFGVASGETEPGYVTWDAKLGDNVTHIENVMLMLCNLIEIAPEIIGWRVGADAEATDTLRIRCANTLAKVARKKLYIEESLQRVLSTACQFAGGGEIAPEDIQIAWSDGLPIIESEIARQESEKVLAGLTSRKRAIMRVHGVDEDEAAAILAEIVEEESSALPLGFAGEPGEKIGSLKLAGFEPEEEEEA